MPVILTGGPIEASRQLIEHLRQNRAWPDDDESRAVSILNDVLAEFVDVSKETAEQISALFADRLRAMN